MGVAGCVIREAGWPQDLAAARVLLRHYREHLAANPAGAVHLDLQAYEQELAVLDRRWGPPLAVLLLAMVDGAAGGCAGVHLLPERPRSAELKRMWVEPSARGHGAGRALAEAAIAWARQHGADELLLDTVPAVMQPANRLYAALGFEPCERYNDNPVADVTFFQLRLR